MSRMFYLNYCWQYLVCLSSFFFKVTFLFQIVLTWFVCSISTILSTNGLNSADATLSNKQTNKQTTSTKWTHLTIMRHSQHTVHCTQQKQQWPNQPMTCSQLSIVENQLCRISIDISAAFNVLDHDRLNRATELFGLFGQVIDWPESYLT